MRKRNFHKVALLEREAIAKAERIRSEDMDMNVSWAAVSFVLEMVMFQIGYGMAHVLLP